MSFWPIVGFLMAVPTPIAGAPTADQEKTDAVRPDRSSEPASVLSGFLVAHLPLTDRFETNRQTWTNDIPQDLITADFHIARFPGGDEQLTIRQLNDALRSCALSDRMNANLVSITIHYDCAREKRARIVYNFRDGRVKRVLVGDIPQVLQCGICVDKAAN